MNVVNELRASGAGDFRQRRKDRGNDGDTQAGQYIVINGKQFRAPFVIKAIADPDNLEGRCQ